MMSVASGLQAENVEGSEFGGVSSKKSTGELKETRIRSKRSVVKRRITTTLRKLEELIAKTGSKTMIKGYVNNLFEYLNEAECLNNELLAFVHENEHELVLNWYEEQLERVELAKLEAMSHLEGRLHEVSSVAGTFPGKQTSPQLPTQLYSKSVVTCSSKSSGKRAEVRAKAFAAELKAKQLMEEEEKRKQEREKQLELEKNVAMAQAIAEKAKFEAEERRKIQEATDEWRRLRAEAELLEEDDPECLSNRLRDFDNEPQDNKQSVAFPQPISETDQAKDKVPSHQPETNCHNVPSIHQVQQTYSNDNTNCCSSAEG